MLIFIGTGSGSLSQSIIQVIGEKGHLFTFEFNEDRVSNARSLFQKLNFKNVTVAKRDACNEGFLS